MDHYQVGTPLDKLEFLFDRSERHWLIKNFGVNNVDNVKKVGRISLQAIHDGHIQILEILYSHGHLKRPSLDNFFRYAVEKSKFHIADWLINHGAMFRSDGLFIQGAIRGDIKIFEWLKSRNFHPRERSACSIAVRNGHLEALKWLHAERCPWNANALYKIAVAKGFGEIAKWIRDISGFFVHGEDVDGAEIELSSESSSDDEEVPEGSEDSEN